MKIHKVVVSPGSSVYFASQGAAIASAAEALKETKAETEIVVLSAEVGVPSKAEVIDMLNMCRQGATGFAGDDAEWVTSAVVYRESFGDLTDILDPVYAVRRRSARLGRVTVESIDR